MENTITAQGRGINGGQMVVSADNAPAAKKSGHEIKVKFPDGYETIRAAETKAPAVLGTQYCIVFKNHRPNGLRVRTSR